MSNLSFDTATDGTNQFSIGHKLLDRFFKCDFGKVPASLNFGGLIDPADGKTYKPPAFVVTAITFNDVGATMEEASKHIDEPDYNSDSGTDAKKIYDDAINTEAKILAQNFQ